MVRAWVVLLGPGIRQPASAGDWLKPRLSLRLGTRDPPLSTQLRLNKRRQKSNFRTANKSKKNYRMKNTIGTSSIANTKFGPPEVSFNTSTAFRLCTREKSKSQAHVKWNGPFCETGNDTSSIDQGSTTTKNSIIDRRSRYFFTKMKIERSTVSSRTWRRRHI